MKTTNELITKYLLSVEHIYEGLQIRSFEFSNGEIIGKLEYKHDEIYYGVFTIDLLDYITYLYNNKHI